MTISRWAYQISTHTLRIIQLYTLPETNIAPENQRLEDEVSFQMAYIRSYYRLGCPRIPVTTRIMNHF